MQDSPWWSSIPCCVASPTGVLFFNDSALYGVWTTLTRSSDLHGSLSVVLSTGR